MSVLPSCFGKCSHLAFNMPAVITHSHPACITAAPLSYVHTIKPLLWLTDPFSHVQICTLSLYITPTAHFLFTLLNKIVKSSQYPPCLTSSPLSWPWFNGYSLKVGWSSSFHSHIRKEECFGWMRDKWGSVDNVRGWHGTVMHKTQAEMNVVNHKPELEVSFGCITAAGQKSFLQTHSAFLCCCSWRTFHPHSVRQTQCTPFRDPEILFNKATR